MEDRVANHVRELDERIEKSIVREVVMTLARGSVVLQNGDYLTEAELEADRAFMRKYKLRYPSNGVISYP